MSWKTLEKSVDGAESIEHSASKRLGDLVR